MTFTLTIVLVCWLAILVVWSMGALRTKRSVRVPRGGLQLAIGLMLLGGFALLVQGLLVGNAVSTAMSLLGWTGVALTVAGAVFAIWARLTLGTNWSGAVVTVKERHQLVTRGPYRFVRHPIYTGLLAVALGEVVLFPTWYAGLGFVLIAAALLVRVPQEEALMLAMFPEAYAAYQKTAKRLIPLIW